MYTHDYWSLPLPDSIRIKRSEEDKSKSIYVLYYDRGLNSHQRTLPITLDTSHLMIQFIGEGALAYSDVQTEIKESIPKLREATDRILKIPKDQLTIDEIAFLLKKFNVDGKEMPPIHKN